MGKFFRNVALIFLAFIAISLIVAGVSGSGAKPKTATLAQLVGQVDANQVSKIVVDSTEMNMTVTLKDNSIENVTKEAMPDVAETLKNAGASDAAVNQLDIEPQSTSTWAAILEESLPFLIPFIFICVFVYFLMRNVQGQNNKAISFGQTSARMQDDRKKKVTFADVAGVKEAKQELHGSCRIFEVPAEVPAARRKDSTWRALARPAGRWQDAAGTRGCR